jgi:hypothetical protein
MTPAKLALPESMTLPKLWIITLAGINDTGIACIASVIEPVKCVQIPKLSDTDLILNLFDTILI